MTMTAAPAGDLPVMVRAQSRCCSKQTVNNNLVMRRAGLSVDLSEVGIDAADAFIAM